MGEIDGAKEEEGTPVVCQSGGLCPSSSAIGFSLSHSKSPHRMLTTRRPLGFDQQEEVTACDDDGEESIATTVTTACSNTTSSSSNSSREMVLSDDDLLGEVMVSKRSCVEGEKPVSTSHHSFLAH